MEYLTQGMNQTFQANLKNRDGTAYDLTNKSCTIRWHSSSGYGTAAMTVTDIVGGVCKYKFGTSDLVEGRMDIEVIITDDLTGDLVATNRVASIPVRRGVVAA